jgi:hypothetical protein
MLTSYNDIKAQLLEEWEHITESRLHEYAESNTPVYNADIAKEWQELPGEATDAWKEYGIELGPETTIYGLMTNDLQLYYYALVERAFAEIKTAKEEELENA